MRAALFVLLASSAALGAPLPSARQGPWIELQGGPFLQTRSGRKGVGSGPLMRLNLGVAMGDRAAAEVWLSGALESAPIASPGDRALLGGGVSGRLLLGSFAAGKLGFWARGGVGLSAATAGPASTSPLGFAGAAILFQPFVNRFAVGLEVDGVASRSSLGFAILPSLRCAM